MKKFNLILILFFACFVCVCDVYADAYCSIIDSNPTYSYGCLFKNLDSPQIRNHVVHHGYGPRGSSEWTDLNIIDYSNATNVYNYNLFGYYQSGNLIPYSEPNHNYYEYAIDLSSTREVYTDSNGNVEYYTFYAATDYVDISFGANFAPWTSNRLDFAIHVNFNTIPDNIRKAIMGSFIVDPVMPTIGGSYCDSSYENSNEVIRVSCSFDYKGEDVVVRLKNLNNIDTNFNDSVNSYHYYMYFDISAYESVWTINNRVEDLQSTDSPNGNKFDSDYNYVSNANNNMNSFFNSFGNYSSINSISSIVTAPLRLFNNIKGNCFNTKSNCFNASAFTFDVFGHTVRLKTGYDVFWGKCANDRTISGTCNANRRINPIYINDTEITSVSSYTLLRNFRTAWNLLFGGFIIYLLGKRCVRVCMKMFNPDIVDLEVF